MMEIVEQISENYSVADIEKLQSLLDQIKKLKRENPNAITLYSFKVEYERFISDSYSKDYSKSVQLSFKHLLNYFGEEKPISEINNRNLEQFKTSLIKSAPAGTSVYFRTLKASFNKAVEWGYIFSNPFNKIKFGRKQEISPVFINKNELESILGRTKSEMMRDIFTLSFYTGCRLSEVLHLRWENIDSEKQLITIGDENFTTKNGKSRVIPIASELMAVLNSRRLKEVNQGKYIFHKANGFPFNRDYVSRYFKKSRREAGLSEKIHFHTLRHSFASNLALRGVPIIVIKELLGHSSIITTQIYSHPDLDSLITAVGKFDE